MKPELITGEIIPECTANRGRSIMISKNTARGCTARVCVRPATTIPECTQNPSHSIMISRKTARGFQKDDGTAAVRLVIGRNHTAAECPRPGLRGIVEARLGRGHAERAIKSRVPRVAQLVCIGHTRGRIVHSRQAGRQKVGRQKAGRQAGMQAGRHCSRTHRAAVSTTHSMRQGYNNMLLPHTY